MKKVCVLAVWICNEYSLEEGSKFCQECKEINDIA